jgi:HAD superfamily hydrolase (TIGR01509 family)
MSVNTSCLIYDLDGTILNSMPLHEEGWRMASEAFFVPITSKMLRDLAGRPINEIAATLLKTKEQERIEAFVNLNHDYIMKHTDRITIFPDFIELLKRLNGTRPIWICTSSTKDFVMKIFDNHPEIARLRENTVYREMYTKGKPDPEALLFTCKKAGFLPKDCIYVGDAYNDYAAATAAGLRFIYYDSDGIPEERIPIGTPTTRNHLFVLDFLSK